MIESLERPPLNVHCPQCRGIFRVREPHAGESTECPFCSAAYTFRDAATVVLDDAPDWEVRTFQDGEAPTPADASDAPVHAADRTDFVPGDEVAGYRLEEVVGTGGMSVVFRATQLSLDRNVAFKVLRKDLGRDPEFTRRFFKEARALAELSHQNIVSVYDQGEVDGHCFLVMEYVDGVSLREVLEDRRLTPRDTIEVIPSLCGALEYAHGKGFVHRDIKPENILIDADGTPKIADFGLVRMVADPLADQTRLTKTRTVLGTVDYMSPEQREGRRDIDHRADLYSLGVVFYEMLTGELPIARFPKPSERVDCDERLDEVVLRLLEKDRGLRYGRASQISRDLHEISTRPPRRPRPANHAGRAKSDLSDAEPLDTWDRILRMGASFSFFTFTIIWLALLLGNQRDDDVIAMLVGIAAPFYGAQLSMHGFLPRLRVPPRLWVIDHPILTFGALTFIVGVSSGSKYRWDEPMYLLLGLLPSLGLSLAFWRNKALRRSRQEPVYRRPPTPTEVARTKKRRERPIRNAIHDPPKPSGDAMKLDTASSTTTPVSTDGSAARTRYSLGTVLTSLLLIPVTGYALAMFIGSVVVGPGETVFHVPESHDFGADLVNVWKLHPETLERWTIFSGWIALTPLLVPALVWLLSVPSVIRGERRGRMLAGVNFAGLFLASTLAIASVGELVSKTSLYRETALRSPTASESHELEHAATAAVKATDPVRRFAEFHRLYRGATRTNDYGSTVQILEQLVRNRDEPRNDRQAASYLIDVISDRQADQNGTGRSF